MPRTLLIDFETYSEVDVTRVGAYRYAQHPSTEIVCMSISEAPEDPERDAEVTLWTPEDGPLPRWVVEAVCDTHTLMEAHNAQFERCIWEHVGVPRYDFPPVFDRQWRCSLAVCGYRALPLSLEKAALALGLSVQKDMAGNRAMKKISRPDTKTGERVRDFSLEQRTYSYCVDDNVAERHLHRAVGSLPAPELQIWQLDQTIQARGVRIDRDLCEAAVEIAAEVERRLTPELSKVTGGAIKTAGQVAAIGEWLRERGIDLPDMTADTVREALKDERVLNDDAARRVLEIRRTLATSSHKKYARALECVCDDGRVRGTTQYHGATTGRWAGRLLQPQNFRRPVYFGEGDEIEDLAAAIKTRDPDLVEIVAGCDVMEALADGVRGMIVSDDEALLTAGDFSAIEAVVTAALAGEQRKLDVFRRGEDPYCWFASKVVGREVLPKKHPDVTPDDLRARQLYGKPGELAFGFSGGVGAWRKFSDELSDDEVDRIKRVWREEHSNVVDLWNALDTCVLQAVANPGQVFHHVGAGNTRDQGIAFCRRGDYLLMQLPGGRRLHYYRPEIRQTLMPWTDDDDGEPVYRPQVWYWTTGMKGWQRVKGWRGQWTENAVQAVSRDILVPGMFAAERAGFPVVLTVHDEILTEPWRIMRPDPEEFAETIVDPPSFAADWPISAGGWVGTRYRKE